MEKKQATIAHQIKTARIAAGLTQVACAERLGTSQQHIQQAERKGAISLLMLSKLGEVLNTTFTVHPGLEK